MARFQVVAVYPSGTRYPVRAPHAQFLSAVWHRRLCERAADPRDTWVYEIDMTYTGVDGQRHWRGDVDGVRDLGYSPAEVANASWGV